MAAAQANYRRQLARPATVLVEVYCERMGNTSLTIAYRVVDAGDCNVAFADGNTVMVWIDSATGRPVALPSPIVAARR